MRYKTLFRVWLKMLGIYLVVTSLGGIIYSITEIVLEASGIGVSRPLMWRFSLQYLLSMAIGLYLFFGGKWITDLAIPSNRPYCAECGYDIGHSPGDTCQECGANIRHELPATTIKQSD